MKRSIFLAAIVLGSCTPIYKISTNSSEGIPFYSQQLIKKIDYVYAENYYEIQFALTYEQKSKTSEGEGDKRTFSTTTIKYARTKCAIKLNNLFSSQTNPSAAKREVEKVFENSTPGSNNECSFRDNEQSPYIGLKAILGKLNLKSKEENDDWPKEIGGKSGVVPEFVSESTNYKLELEDAPRYINIRKPFLGAAEGTITLNENGTLASAATSITDETVGKVLDLVPFSDIITSKLDLGEAKVAAEEIPLLEDLIPVDAKISLIPITRTYTITQAFHKVGKKWTSKYTNYNITKTKGSVPSETNEKKNIISLEGKLILPEAKEEVKKED